MSEMRYCFACKKAGRRAYHERDWCPTTRQTRGRRPARPGAFRCQSCGRSGHKSNYCPYCIYCGGLVDGDRAGYVAHKECREARGTDDEDKARSDYVRVASGVVRAARTGSAQ